MTDQAVVGKRQMSRGEFLALTGLGLGGAALFQTEKADAFPDIIDAIAMVGAFKDKLVGLFRASALAANYLADNLEKMSWQLYGANFARVPGPSRNFHFEQSLGYGPSVDIGSLSDINLDGLGSRVALRRKQLPSFEPVELVQAGSFTDFNLSEVSFANYIVEKCKTPIPQVLPIGERIAFDRIPKANKDLSEALIERCLAAELSASTVSRLRDDFKLLYARRMPTKSGTPQAFGVCYEHCKSHNRVYWSFGIAPPFAKGQPDLLAEHIEVSIHEPLA
jgi:hypothetical protein